MVCRIFLGIVLLAAAGLKAEELANLPMLGPGFLNQRWVLVGVIEIQALLAGVLLFNGSGFRTWLGTLLLWMVFFSVALYEAVSGVASCGCFGRVTVNPWYTAGFDLLVLIILPLCIPARAIPGRIIKHRVWRWVGIGTFMSAAAIFGGWNLDRYKSSRLSEDGLSLVDGTVILEPQKWVGQRLMLAKYIDIGSQLEQGDWIVLLYRYDCEHCQRAVPRYAAFAKQHQFSSAPRVALVEIPPFAQQGQELTKTSGAAVLGQLSKQQNWFASTPVMIRMRTGRVSEVEEGEAAENLPFEN